MMVLFKVGISRYGMSGQILVYTIFNKSVDETAPSA